MNDRINSLTNSIQKGLTVFCGSLIFFVSSFLLIPKKAGAGGRWDERAMATFSLQEVLSRSIPSSALDVRAYLPFVPLEKEPAEQALMLSGLTPELLSSFFPAVKLDGEDRFQPDISFLTVDLKRVGAAIKIIDLGEGKRGGCRTSASGLEGGDEWQELWSHLATLKIPIFYVGPLAKRKAGASAEALPLMAPETFSRIPHAMAFESLQRLERLLALKNLPLERGDVPSSLSGVAGLLIHRYRDDRDVSSLRALELFRQRHPEIMVLDRVFRPFAANKILADLLFRCGEDLAGMRPACVVCRKGCDSQLVDAVRKAIPGERLVIKPLNSSRGNGVIVTGYCTLGRDLRRIFRWRELYAYHAHPYTLNYSPVERLSYGYWIGDTNQTFLVEQYVPGCPLTVEGRDYDPTLRVSCLLTCDGDKIGVSILGARWMLPGASLDDAAATPTSKHVSRSDLPIMGLMLADGEIEQLKLQLCPILASLHAKMIYVHTMLGKRRAGQPRGKSAR